jgi:preprotein translocase subunit SecG
MTAIVPVLRVLHVFVTLAMIGVVLIQRSEGGGLGIGTSQGMGAFMSGRGTANLLTRTTAILAALFFGISLTLALLAHGNVAGQRDILAPSSGSVHVPVRPPVRPPAVPGAPETTPPGRAPASALPAGPLPEKPAAPSVPK